VRIDNMLGELAGADIASRSLEQSREDWALARGWNGLSQNGDIKLLQPGNVKLEKNPVKTWGLTLSPAATAGHNVCERSTPQCRAACVMWTAGRGVFPKVRQARIARTDFLATQPLSFLRLLHHELQQLAEKHDPFAVRFNVASDIRWEKFPQLFDWPNLQAYDYTKWDWTERLNRPKNYRITYSHNERWTDLDVYSYLTCGDNVAMVFDVPKHQLPPTWNGETVIDGDVDDYRYGDPKSVIVGLAAKGAAKNMNAGGFVTHVDDPTTPPSNAADNP
jgi:hypothetical protein